MCEWIASCKWQLSAGRTCRATRNYEINIQMVQSASTIYICGTWKNKISIDRTVTNGRKDDFTSTYFLQKCSETISVSAIYNNFRIANVWKWNMKLKKKKKMFIRRSGTSPAHYQYQQCHRFIQTSRMRSAFEPKKSLGFVKETLGRNERITLPASSLMKPLLFTAAVSLFVTILNVAVHLQEVTITLPFIHWQFSTASFVGATIWEYENYRAKMIQAMRKPLNALRDNFQHRKGDMVRYSNWLVLQIYNFTKTTNLLQISRIKTAWNSLSPGDRFFVPICALNLIVFGLWRIPRLKTFMVKYFCSNPVASMR